MSEEKRPPQVFISYSRRDLAFVEGLAADLQAAGLDVWYDLSGWKAIYAFPPGQCSQCIIPLSKP